MMVFCCCYYSPDQLLWPSFSPQYFISLFICKPLYNWHRSSLPKSVPPVPHSPPHNRFVSFTHFRLKTNIWGRKWYFHFNIHSKAFYFDLIGIYNFCRFMLILTLSRHTMYMYVCMYEYMYEYKAKKAYKMQCTKPKITKRR